MISRVAPSHSIRVLADGNGERIDVWLGRSLEIGRRYAQRLIERGGVRIDGHRAKKGMRLRADTTVEVASFRHPREGVLPNPDLVLSELARAKGLVAFDKPAGLPSHPLDFDETRTAANAALARIPVLGKIGEPLECGLVHRLDVATSGVLVFATEEGAWTSAREALSERTAEKHYRARVHGQFTHAVQHISLELADRGPRVAVVEQGGREAVTIIERIGGDEHTTLVDIEIKTGVRHQIRATLAHFGHPVVGDAIYGSESEIDRHLLHARSIRIGAFSAQAPLPDALR